MERVRPSDRPAILQSAQELQERSDNVVLLRYPEAVSDEFYYDSVHLNEVGRAAFSLWLAGELASLTGQGVTPRASPRARVGVELP